MWSASGDERGTKPGLSTISLGRPQCVRRVSAGPTERRKIHQGLQLDKQQAKYTSAK
jgi:hypothetical protein